MATHPGPVRVTAQRRCVTRSTRDRYGSGKEKRSGVGRAFAHSLLDDHSRPTNTSGAPVFYSDLIPVLPVVIQRELGV
jgi:hypothetical protein